jgi:Fur family transcriptional regulator, iron response regulator
MGESLHQSPDVDFVELLRKHGVGPTAQRLMVVRLLFQTWAHLSAEEVYRRLNTDGRCISKATVYNALGLLSAKGVIREVIVDPSKVFYDPNTEPHHHFYNVATGELQDIGADQLRISELPSLPKGTVLEGADVIVRLRPAK